MSGFLKNLVDSLRLQDDDEAFEEYERSQNARSERSERNTEKVRRASGGDTVSSSRAASSSRQVSPSRTSQAPSSSAGTAQSKKAAHTASNYGSSTYIESIDNKKTLRMERPEGSKVVPIKTTREGLEVCVMRPHNFEDSQDICDVILSNCVAIVNLEENDINVSQRIMDFISGAVYSLNGKLFQISDLIFIAAPGNVDVSGDYNDILAQTGYDVPLLNKN